MAAAQQDTHVLRGQIVSRRACGRNLAFLTIHTDTDRTREIVGKLVAPERGGWLPHEANHVRTVVGGPLRLAFGEGRGIGEKGEGEGGERDPLDMLPYVSVCFSSSRFDPTLVRHPHALESEKRQAANAEQQQARQGNPEPEQRQEQQAAGNEDEGEGEGEGRKASNAPGGDEQQESTRQGRKGPMNKKRVEREHRRKREANVSLGVCQLPFPTSRRAVLLGDVVELVCVRTPPSKAYLAGGEGGEGVQSPRAKERPPQWSEQGDGDPDYVGESEEERGDIPEWRQRYVARFTVVRWFRLGKRYSGNAAELEEFRGGPQESFSKGADPVVPPVGEESEVAPTPGEPKSRMESRRHRRMVEYYNESCTALADMSVEDRVYEVCKRHIARVNATSKVCERCWLLPKHCMCAHWKDLQLQHRVVVLMHHKEFKRTSNTGKIILASAREHAELLIGSSRSDEARVLHLCSQPNTVILFPSPESKTISEFLEAAKARAKREGQQESISLNVIVLDGTWNQARALNRHLPASVPRVRVTPQTFSLFLIRQQTQPDRICTIEAIAMALQEMGEPAHVTDYLLHVLKAHVNHCRKQGGAVDLPFDLAPEGHGSPS